jgi:hemerythrin-like domain-containing protein
MSKNKEVIADIKEIIEPLKQNLSEYPDQSTEMLDILDVLTQVNKKIDSEKNPEALVMRLLNYIRSVSMKGKIHYSKDDESMIMKLGEFGQKAGLNGQYMADFSDKSQFYSLTESVPQH